MDVTSLVWGMNEKCPQSPMWRVKAKLGRETEVCPLGGSREGNVCNDALHVIGL